MHPRLFAYVGRRQLDSLTSSFFRIVFDSPANSWKVFKYPKRRIDFKPEGGGFSFAKKCMCWGAPLLKLGRLRWVYNCPGSNESIFYLAHFF